MRIALEKPAALRGEMVRRIPLPTVADYIAAMLEIDGPFTVCGKYYGTADDAEVQRRRTAIRWVANDARRVAAIHRMMQNEQAA